MLEHRTGRIIAGRRQLNHDVGRSEALEFSSLLPLYCPRDRSRESQPTPPPKLAPRVPLVRRQQAGWSQSGSKLPHSNTGFALRPLSLALLVWLAITLHAQTAVPADADPYIQQFESSYHDVLSLRADFRQTYTLGGRTRIESGRVEFGRGGLMRWDYQRPMEKLFVSDGKEVSLYVPEEHQLTRTSLKASEDFRAPFELLLTRLNLRKVFARVDLADAALDHDPGNHVLRALPKKEFAEEYTDVLIELDPQFNMRRLVVNYPDHSRMDFEFDHIERNPQLPLSLFQFTAPAGTEIIDQH